jgi:hypothetical protein
VGGLWIGWAISVAVMAALPEFERAWGVS